MFVCINNISRGGSKESLALLFMAMDRTFETKLNQGKPFVILVKQCLADYGYEAKSVPLSEEHKGDLHVTDRLTGERFYLGVKADSSIANTHNMYIELRVDRNGKKSDGGYHYDYSRIAVVDSSAKVKNPANKKSIYIIDWEKMKTELDLDDSRCKKIRHLVDGNYNTALLVPLRYIIARGWRLDEYFYDANDWRRAVEEAKN